MQGKKLALINGLTGLIGGISLLIAPVLLAASVTNDLSNSLLSERATASTTTTMSTVFLIVKIAILVLGIMGAVKFKESTEVTAAPSVLLIVGGAVSLVPFLGFAGGIVSIVGGGLYLSKLKNFN